MAELLFKLFIAFLRVGAFSIGGGYLFIAHIQDQLVYHHEWLSMQEFTDMLTISRTLPGPIVLNTASFVGAEIAGFPGTIIAVIASIITGFIVSLSLYKLFDKHSGIESVSNVLKGLRAASFGLIAAASVAILRLAFIEEEAIIGSFFNINFLALAVFLLSLYVLRKWEANPVHVILACGLLGLLLYS